MSANPFVQCTPENECTDPGARGCRCAYIQKQGAYAPQISDEELEMRCRAQRLHGLFTGACAPAEYEDLLAAGIMRRTYGGAAGFLGLSKLELVEP